MDDIQIGDKIRVLRKKLGYTQQELAKKIGITWEMISRYERGKSSALNKILELADALETELNYFVTTETTSTLKDAQFIKESFIPLLDTVPPSRKDLLRKLASENNGTRVYGNVEIKSNFAVRLSENSKIAIKLRTVLPYGLLICTSELESLENGNIVITVNNGLVSIEEFDNNQIAIAKIVRWSVDFS